MMNRTLNIALKAIAINLHRETKTINPDEAILTFEQFIIITKNIGTLIGITQELERELNDQDYREELLRKLNIQDL